MPQGNTGSPSPKTLIFVSPQSCFPQAVQVSFFFLPKNIKGFYIHLFLCDLEPVLQVWPSSDAFLDFHAILFKVLVHGKGVSSLSGGGLTVTLYKHLELEAL